MEKLLRKKKIIILLIQINPASTDGQAWFSLWSGKRGGWGLLDFSFPITKLLTGSCNEPFFMYLVILDYSLGITNDTSHKLWILLGFPEEY